MVSITVNEIATVATVAASAITLAGTMFGTVAYIVKKQETRQEKADQREREISDRFFNHLESRDRQTQETIKTFAETIGKMQASLDQHNSTLLTVSEGIKGILTNQMSDNRRCQYTPKQS